jgi:hypothetical protein
MKAMLLIACTAVLAGATENCPVKDDFTGGKTQGVRPQDQGQFTADGWNVTTGQTQIKYDLGRHYRKGMVELQVRGPLRQPGKHSVIAGWNEEAAVDGDRKTQSFYQLRLTANTMMLRLTHRAGGRSFEGKAAPIDWKDGEWYTIKGTWDATGGENHLWLNGKRIQTGTFNGPFEGFRWFFLGKDNYQKQHAVPGLTYRNVKICVE